MSATKTQALSPFGEAALEFVSQGLAVVQLTTKSKQPRKGSCGYKDATKDPEEVRRLWTEYPNGNVAAATGKASNVVVIDVDGLRGKAEFIKLTRRFGNLPDSVTVISPGKKEKESGESLGIGEHLYFRLPPGVESNTMLGVVPNVDFMAEPGYVVLPPSVHPDETGTYKFSPGRAVGEIEIAELPQAWAEFFVAESAKRGNASQKKTVAVSEKPQYPDTIINPDDQLLQRIYSYLDECDGSVQGGAVPGHSTLMTVANALVHGFCLEPSAAADIAWKQYNPKCQPPWTDAERHDFDRKFTEAADKPPNLPYGWLLKKQPSITLTGQVDPTMGKLVLNVERTLPTAEAFIRTHYTVDGVRTLHYLNGIFYERQYNAYCPVEEDSLRSKLLYFLDKAFIRRSEKGKFVLEPFPAKKSNVDNALDALKGVARLPSDTSVPCWLGNDPAPVHDPSMILFGKSRNLDLATMTTFDPSPRWFNFNSLDFDYEPNPDPSVSRCPRWDEFLLQLFDNDLEGKQTLLQYMGLLLTPITKFQKALFLVGPKRSGKGTVGRITRKLVGEFNVAAPTTDSLAGAFGLQSLIGKTVAIVSDARFNGQNQSVLTERILTITGEDTLTIDRKYLAATTMRLPTRFLFLSNEIPRLTDASGALASRFIILKLTKSFFGSEDLELEGKLLAELPGILEQCINALQELLKQGYFKQPASAQSEVELLEGLTSPVSQFVRDRCDTGNPAYWAISDRLWDAWKAWCYEEGQAFGSTNTFFRNLNAPVPRLKHGRLPADGTG